MAELLKNLINDEFFEHLRIKTSISIPNFNYSKFINLVYDKDWEKRELKDRTKHIANSFHLALNEEYPKSIKKILSLLKEVKKEPLTKNGLGYLFFSEYVELFGLEYFEISMKAIEEITQLMSCEFSIRQFILRYEKETMEQMLKWSKHTNYHVRRLSSEGCRPRLPWAVAIPNFKKDPKLILPILENLKNDEYEFVRKSVANNLNDISKDNPEIVINIAKKWQGVSENTDWIIKHACRTLLKKADSEIYNIFGINDNPNYKLENFTISEPEVSIGGKLPFSFTLTNENNGSTNYRLEYVVYYLKANGKHSKKLFKIMDKELKSSESIEVKREQSFQNFTTRKHYKGLHEIGIVVNGKESDLISFEVV